MEREVILLCCHGEPMREFALPERALEVGSAVGCDIVVHDPEVAERQLLIQARQGTVFFKNTTVFLISG